MKISVQYLSRSLRGILATAAIAVGAADCASHDPGDVEGTLGDPNVTARLHDLALQISSISGVASPRKMYAAAVSDYQAAGAVLGGSIVGGHVPVFVIVMTGGRFTALDAPPGVPPPEGNVLTVIVNAKTFEATDVGIVNAEPDLSKIASATADLSAQ